MDKIIDIKIEQNIPIPENNRKHSVSRQLCIALKGMAIGDSFIVPDDISITLVENCANKMNITITRKKIDGKYRVWRLK